MLFSEFCISKDQRYYKNWTKEAVFVYILGFIFYGVFRAKIWSMIFFLSLPARGPFHRKGFKWKKIWGTSLISEKVEDMYA